jgi:ferredoxin
MRMRGIPFNADSKELAADIEFLWDCQGSECSVCGVEIVLGSRGGRAAADAAQLDALNPSRPYQQGNMSFLCAPCNGSKGDLTIETTRRLYQFLLEEVDVDH